MSVSFVGFALWGTFEFHTDVIFVQASISPVLDIPSGQSQVMLGNSVFTDWKISDESLKSPGKVREI